MIAVLKARPLMWPLAQAGVVALMGPVILALAGNASITWDAALASLKITGPLAAVVMGGQLLLRWSELGREARS